MATHLFPSFPFDMPLGGMFILFFATIILSVAAFVGIVLIEAIVLRLLKWDSFWRSLLDSFLVNLGTTILGFLLNLGLNAIGLDSLFVGRSTLGSLVSMVVQGAMSVAAEGVLLLWIRRRPAAETWRAILIANVVGYVVLGAVFAWMVWGGGADALIGRFLPGT